MYLLTHRHERHTYAHKHTYRHKYTYTHMYIHTHILYTSQKQHSLHTNWSSSYCPTVNNYICMFTITAIVRQLVCFSRLHFADYVNLWLLKWCQWRHRFITPRYGIGSKRRAPQTLLKHSVSVECMEFLTFGLLLYAWWRRRFITTDIYGLIYSSLWFFVCVYHWLAVLALKTSNINYIYGFISGFMMNKDVGNFFLTFIVDG